MANGQRRGAPPALVICVNMMQVQVAAVWPIKQANNTNKNTTTFIHTLPLFGDKFSV